MQNQTYQERVISESTASFASLLPTPEVSLTILIILMIIILIIIISSSIISIIKPPNMVHTILVCNELMVVTSCPRFGTSWRTEVSAR